MFLILHPRTSLYFVYGKISYRSGCLLFLVMPALGRYVVLRNCLILLKVTSLVLKSIFLLQTKEIDWLYEGGVDAVIFRDVFCSQSGISCEMGDEQISGFQEVDGAK
ncbi:hypothetical protein RND81_01G057400 [Saponaria officinalis]|uniref:Uncharacterized protein n=1 Tax=Saponaria officinalis TaxID=3572 RepID=A0AAW1N5Y8_SAPOF